MLTRRWRGVTQPDPNTPARNPLACGAPVPGDTVVHLDFGLCRLVGLRRLELSDTTVDTITLLFKNGETRHVPVADSVRIWNYGAYVPDSGLDPLDNADWAARQVEVVTELRASMAALRKRRDARLARVGHGVAVTDDHIEAAGAGFAHELTDCQTAALSDIVADMRADVAANRLLVGDVGCGKTEVAVRALLATALAGGRGRLVAPTRVLARQHYEDVRERAEALGLKVALYSGDLTDKAKRAAVHTAEQTDILIGTHGLLGEAFAQLSFALTVIDEEQKFGAKIKRAGYAPESGGNTLRLSATPIPATIAEARIGLSDLSVISTYPKGRAKTDTRTAPMEDAALRHAATAEFERGGQVLIMAPRIADLKAVKPLIKRLFPDRRFGTVHGQRKAKANRKTLRKLRAGKRDGLLATTVLETGVNLPDANTMIVLRPERFGLAQLHQLRGRIGRGSVPGVFLMLSGEDATTSWAQRLGVLETLHRRGDGLTLALADTMLRGSGELDDGDEQTGHASAVGLELYDYLLRQGEADDPFTLVPKIVGDADWGLPEATDTALAAAFSGSRAALNGEACSNALCELIARCRALGADRATVGPKGVVLERGEREVLRADTLDAALSGPVPVAA